MVKKFLAPQIPAAVEMQPVEGHVIVSHPHPALDPHGGEAVDQRIARARSATCSCRRQLSS